MGTGYGQEMHVGEHELHCHMSLMRVPVSLSKRPEAYQPEVRGNSHYNRQYFLKIKHAV